MNLTSKPATKSEDQIALEKRVRIIEQKLELQKKIDLGAAKIIGGLVFEKWYYRGGDIGPVSTSVFIRRIPEYDDGGRWISMDSVNVDDIKKLFEFLKDIE